MKLNIYSDGGARGNPGPGAIGVVILNGEEEILREHKDTVGEATNNMAEYLALIAAQEIAAGLGADEANFHLDSELVVKQLKGEYRVKDEKMRHLWTAAKSSEKNFKSISYTHLPRTHEWMQEADRLVNEALDSDKHG